MAENDKITLSDKCDSSATSSNSGDGSVLTSGDDWQYTKEGLSFWLNNMPEKSTEHFKAKLDSTPIFAGYAFVVSMVSK